MFFKSLFHFEKSLHIGSGAIGAPSSRVREVALGKLGNYKEVPLGNHKEVALGNHKEVALGKLGTLGNHEKNSALGNFLHCATCSRCQVEGRRLNLRKITIQRHCLVSKTGHLAKKMWK